MNLGRVGAVTGRLERPGALPADELARMADRVAAARRRFGPEPQIDPVLEENELGSFVSAGILPDQEAMKSRRAVSSSSHPSLRCGRKTHVPAGTSATVSERAEQSESAGADGPSATSAFGEPSATSASGETTRTKPAHSSNAPRRSPKQAATTSGEGAMRRRPVASARMSSLLKRVNGDVLMCARTLLQCSGTGAESSREWVRSRSAS